jgi:HK97 family phage major capsid protein
LLFEEHDMSKIKDLKQHKAELLKAAAALGEATDEATTAKFESIMKEHDGVVALLDRAIRLAEAEVASTEDAPDPEAITAAKARQAGVKPFANLGEQVISAVEAARPGGRQDPRLFRAATGMGEGVSADGGFLVQTDFSADLLTRTYEVGEILKRCRKIPISAGSNGLKINAVNETSRVDGSRLGGIRAYWIAEAAAATASRPVFRQIELNLKKLGALCYATDELLADAPALTALLQQSVPEELAFVTEDAIVNGNGSGKPLGFFVSGAVVSQAKESSQTATTINVQNLAKMYNRMPSRYTRDAVWLCNQDALNQFPLLTLGGSAAATPMFTMPGTGAADEVNYTKAMGRPLIPSEYCATLGTNGDIFFVNLNEYLLIEKGGVEQAVSMHVKFAEDETTLRFIYRVDGQPIWNSALTPKNGSVTLSPYVALDTRS